MTFRNSVVISAVLGCCLYGAPSSAHHPTAANYDTSNVVTLRGVAAKIVFGAPHTYLWLDVQDVGSQATHWVVELDATAKVGAAGFTRRAAAPGMSMTITTYGAKPDANLVAAIPSASAEVHEAAKAGRLVHGIELQLPDGHTIVVGDK
jgi:hypothetical protein